MVSPRLILLYPLLLSSCNINVHFLCPQLRAAISKHPVGLPVKLTFDVREAGGRRLQSPVDAYAVLIPEVGRTLSTSAQSQPSLLMMRFI